jgi:anti-sigma regulatory factor (Ser/Thr protein kinase)
MDDGEGPFRPAPGPAGGPAATAAADAGAGLRHVAFLYRDLSEYLAGLLPFVQEGLACCQPVLVAVPGDRAQAVRAALRAAGHELPVIDMTGTGRNPARITLALTTFAQRHPGRRIRVVTEAAWPERTAAETAEVMKHEALVGLAFTGVGAQILCPYDAGRLSGPLIDGACGLHPEIMEHGHYRPGGSYQTAHTTREARLPAPPPTARSIAYRTRLDGVRALASACARDAGLAPERCADLVLAVSEVAANTLCHTDGGGTVHVWATGQEVVCQVHDSGWITDPMAGRKRPPPESPGQGLWVVNHVCDLVELRSGPGGTTIQLHMRLPGH